MKPNPINSDMLTTLLIAAVLLLSGVLTRRLYAKGQPRTDADIKAMLDRCVDAQRRAPGIVAGIINDKGTRLFSSGDVNGDTLFEIGSITKVFTGLLLQEMADSGEVKLDDPISKFLPATVKTPTRNGRQITLVDLATHTSGLPRLPENLAPSDADNPYADYTVAQLYDFLSHYELKRDIGAEYEYSNLGGGLLGHVLALRAGTDYETLVIRRICDPLGMDSTRITLSPELQSRLTPGHNSAGMPVKNWDLPTLGGAGALRSTAADLLKFLAANIGLTNSALSNAMAQTHQPRHGAGSFLKIALMWHIDTAHDTVWHNGGTGGYRSYIGFKKDKRIGVVVLANSANDVGDIAQYILGDRSDVKEYQPPKARKVAAIDPRVFDDLVGQYKFRLSATTITMTREGNRLFAQMTGQQKIEFFPESETDYFCTVVDAQITFVKDAAGKVARLILHQNGIDQTVTKVK
jgi:serine-type D-Ala-D-Ala carboxypeptidase/endopeptidase